ncbi:hypothetical protein K6T82_06835 [Flavobacterium sp. 17A]|uniref:Lipoprotein n=1 Tax=Flavobacterium potami TaxID=2872310 RepID=A0A9X1H9M3_9FLAO|nr:hypothetical protein [Flavobacterium potami]MBZ4034474.1 hypothetical protein [Flavobacterium potami]
MRNLLLIFTICFFSISCQKEEKKYVSKKSDSKKLDNSKRYLRSIMRLNFKDRTEEIEIYVIKKNDTISNQIKVLKNNKLDTIESCYYDLKISKTDKPNFYSGTITLHSKYENLKLNKNNRRTIEFGYCNLNKDSLYINYITSKNASTLNFEFKNYKNEKLNGILYQITERDSTKELMNLNEIHLLVDNFPDTNNFFLESYDLHKDKKRKINLKGLTLKKDN